MLTVCVQLCVITKWRACCTAKNSRIPKAREIDKTLLLFFPPLTPQVELYAFILSVLPAKIVITEIWKPILKTANCKLIETKCTYLNCLFHSCKPLAKKSISPFLKVYKLFNNKYKLAYKIAKLILPEKSFFQKFSFLWSR